MPPTPERVALPDAPPDPELVRTVRELLAAGALLALPTETVYGIAARADQDAPLAALRELKGRPGDLALTWHVGTDAALDRFPRVSPLVRRLAQRYWPGPMTLVLPGIPTDCERIAREGWTGVRWPAHAGTAGILAALDFPVVLSSANRHGEAPRTDADAVRRDLGQGLALVLDGGPSRLEESSSVLRLGAGRFELLRSGLHDIESLRSVAGLRIAFVCSGNTCRSPMAEGLARALLAQRLECAPERIADFGFELCSMGILARTGSSAAPHAIDVLGERGIDLTAHRSRSATLEQVAAMDRVYGLTHAHLEALRQLLPPSKARHIALLDPNGEEVPDPFGGSRDEYASCAQHIEVLLERRLDEWA